MRNYSEWHTRELIKSVLCACRYSVPTSDFQHPSILAIAGTITKTSASSCSDGLTWFDISCAGSLAPSPRPSQSQSAREILRNSGSSDARKSGSTLSGSTLTGCRKVTFDDILSPNRRKYWSDESSRTLFEEPYGDGRRTQRWSSSLD